MTLVLLLQQPPAGGVTHDLAGTTVGSSGMTGAPRLTFSLAATSAASSTLTGTFGIDLKGTLAGSSGLTGRLTLDLKGTLAGSSTMTGAAVRNVEVTGASSGTSSLTGDLHFVHSLAGVMVDSSSMTGTLFIGISGRSDGTSAMTGGLGVNWSLGGLTAGTGAFALISPDTDLFPVGDLYPGGVAAALALLWQLAVVDAGTSTIKAGDTALAGTLTGISAMGYPRLPATGLLPSTDLLPGVVGGELRVAQLAQEHVIITLSAGVDVLIRLDAIADRSADLTANSILVLVGADNG